jgi:hypothetical protein
VFPSADGVTGSPEHCQDDANHKHNNADGPDDCDVRDEPDNKQNDTENDQLWLLAAAIVSPRITAPSQSCWEETGKGPCRTCQGPEQCQQFTADRSLGASRNKCPRWLFIHGREDQADAIVTDIGQQVRPSTGIGELPEPQEELTIRQRHSIGFITIARPC